MKNYSPYFLLLVATFCSLPYCSYAQQKTHSSDSLATQILGLINEHRAGMGLKPLTSNEIIIAAAENHSRNMAAKKIPLGHKGYDARIDKLSKQIKPTYAS